MRKGRRIEKFEEDLKKMRQKVEEKISFLVIFKDFNQINKIS